MSRTFFGHPIGLSSLFATEMWERFSYYGMRALLVLFLTKSLMDGGFGLDELEAYTIYGIFTAMVYVTPIIGGIMADKWFGERTLIYAGGITKAIGHFTLAASAAMSSDMMEVRQPLFYVGLTILILGNGYFKPNISTMVGQLYDNNDPRKDGGFTIFYMGINLGAFLAPMVAGNLGEHVAWYYGFLTTGCGMLVGTVWFYLRSHTLGRVGMPPFTGERLRLVGKDWGRILFITISSIASAYVFIYGWKELTSLVQDIIIWALTIGGIGYLALRIGSNTKGKTEWSRVGVILILSLFNIFFFSGFEQAGTTFTIFASENTDRVLSVATTRNVFVAVAIMFALVGFWMKTKQKKAVPYYILALIVLGGYKLLDIYVFDGDTYEVAASSFQSINAFGIFIFAPIFTIMWSWLDKRQANPNTPMKFGWGMLLLSLGFIVMAIGNERALTGVLVSPLWLVMVYLLHTLGELCLSPIGLSMVTKLAPPRMVSTMMGVWLGSFAFGNFVGAKMKALSISLDVPIFWFIATETFIVALIAMAISPFLKKMMRGIK